MKDSPLVLASGSPRRLQLLASLGLACEVAPVDVDETPLAGEEPANCAVRLATAKASLARERQPPGRLVLAADTVVAVQGEILGKPSGAADAARMLQRLSGRHHTVHTAVAAALDRRLATRLSSSEVEFRPLDRAEIEAYIATGEPLDKAGAYAIQGRAAVFVAHLSGSHSGVVGLPLFEAAQLLGEFGVAVLPRDAKAPR